MDRSQKEAINRLQEKALALLRTDLPSNEPAANPHCLPFNLHGTQLHLDIRLALLELLLDAARPESPNRGRYGFTTLEVYEQLSQTWRDQRLREAHVALVLQRAASTGGESFFTICCNDQDIPTGIDQEPLWTLKGDPHMECGAYSVREMRRLLGQDLASL